MKGQKVRKLSLQEGRSVPMTVEEKKAVDAAKAKADAEAAAKKKKSTEDPPKVDRSELEKVIAARDEVKKKLKEFEDAKKASDDAEAIKRGEHTKVLGERDAELKDLRKKFEDLEVQTTGLQKAMDDHVASVIAQIPEDKRSLIPVSLSASDKLAYIDKNSTLLLGGKKAKIGGATKPGDMSEVTPREAIEKIMSDTDKPFRERCEAAVEAGMKVAQTE